MTKPKHRSRLTFKHLAWRIRFQRKEIIKTGVRGAVKQCGLSSATYSRLENGQTPSVHALLNVCDWLGISVEDALT